MTPSLAALLARRSVAPRRLGSPGPSEDELCQAAQAALRAPDHGALMPWRLINIPAARRDALATLFVEEKLRRDPLAPAEDLARAREHAGNAPALLAFVVCIHSGVTVPPHEQWLAAGAALGNFLNALHAMGFGAIVLSGDRCRDLELGRQLGLGDGEMLAGFVSAGTVVKVPPAAPLKALARVWSAWDGPVHETADRTPAPGADSIAHR
jgi:nitroreductase